MISPAKTNEAYATSDHETKYVIANPLAHKIVQWLECRCWQDSEFPAGIVSSIYYDSRDWQYLGQKINSDYLKTKVRIRWYHDIDSGEPLDISFLEVKYKIGATRKKVRIKTGYSGAWLARTGLEHPDLLGLPELLRSRDVKVPGPLLPVFQISYRRRRYVDPVSGMRLSIDYDINVPRVNPAMVPRCNPFNLKQAVFETKGGRPDLPETLHQLTALGCIKQSFSKYSSCYQKIMRVDF